jgi:transglutaminase-like putative cysteine protease
MSHHVVMDVRRLRVGCEFVHDAAAPTPTVAQVEPRSEPPVVISDAVWQIQPETPSRTYIDLYGNQCRRFVLPAGRSTIRFEAIATVPDAPEDADESAPELPPEELPDDVMIFTLPSRYCLPDLLGDEAWGLFADIPAGYKRVHAIVDHVHEHIRFRYGSSTHTTTALDVLESRWGVCRDFTHLAISFCRALNIPARYVFGYLPDMDVEPDPAPMDFAAWMEVWLGDRWWTFDPRNGRRRKGRVVIGRGRDASDVAMITTFGAPKLESMVVIAEEVGDRGGGEES